MNIWHSKVSSIFSPIFSQITNKSRISDAVLAALITKLELFLDISVDLKTSLEGARKGNDSINQDTVDRCEFLMESIASYPLEAIKRVTRERILDILVLLDAKLEVGRVHEGARSKLKRLVERLWGLGNASSFLVIKLASFISGAVWELIDVRREILAG